MQRKRNYRRPASIGQGQRAGADRPWTIRRPRYNARPLQGAPPRGAAGPRGREGRIDADRNPAAAFGGGSIGGAGAAGAGGGRRPSRPAGPVGAIEVSLTEAVGLVLAEPVVADVDLPPFDRASGPGYAVRAAEATPGALLRVARPWSDDGHEIEPGEAAPVEPGDPMPLGADAVLDPADVRPDPAGRPGPRGRGPPPRRARPVGRQAGGDARRRRGPGRAPASGSGPRWSRCWRRRGASIRSATGGSAWPSSPWASTSSARPTPRSCTTSGTRPTSPSARCCWVRAGWSTTSAPWPRPTSPGPSSGP